MIKGFVKHKIVFFYNHDPKICPIDENCTVLDVKYHKEYDRQVLLKSAALLMEKDER